MILETVAKPFDYGPCVINTKTVGTSLSIRDRFEAFAFRSDSITLGVALLDYAGTGANASGKVQAFVGYWIDIGTFSLDLGAQDVIAPNTVYDVVKTIVITVTYHDFRLVVDSLVGDEAGVDLCVVAR